MLICRALSMVRPNSVGTSFIKRLTSPRGIAKARLTSRMTARAAKVPKVMISATCSLPYLRVT